MRDAAASRTASVPALARVPLERAEASTEGVREDSAGDQIGSEREQLPPLVIDLDHGILPPALRWELALCALRSDPGAARTIARWASQGPALLEQRVCEIEALDCAHLLVDASALAAARQAHKDGRKVLLLTRSHAALAQRLCQAHACISGVVDASGGDGLAELRAAAAVWAQCPSGFVVLPRQQAGELWARTATAYRPAPSVEAERPRDRSRLSLWARAARLHQWTKNLLIFVPMILAGRALDLASWIAAFTAFLSFGLVASATYLMNDIHDLPHDRAHWSKRERPLASGALPVPHALAAAGLALAGGFCLAALGGIMGVGALAAYLVITVAYTFAIKRYVLLDAVTLAALFTLRLVAGIAFCNVAGSAWLLVLSMFLFTSLALAKRLVEIDQAVRRDLRVVAGRGYVAADAPVVLALGAATSIGAVLIFALYIVEAAGRHVFYATPELLWAAPVALFLWLGRVWVLCGRGELKDDPVEFAVTDRPSLALGLAVCASFALASLPV